MKKSHLKKLAMIGISLGLLSGCQKAKGDEMSSDMKSFYERLSPDAQQKFMQLDAKHKKMAMDIVNQYCKMENQCRGHREQAVEQQYNNQMQQQRSQMNKNYKNQ